MKTIASILSEPLSCSDGQSHCLDENQQRYLASEIRLAVEAERLDRYKLEEKIAQETRTLLFSYNVGTDFIEVISGEFAKKILTLTPLEKAIKQEERERIKQGLEDFERVSNVENYTRIMIPTEVLNKIFSEH